MPEEKTACLIKNGSVVTVESPSPEVRRILEATLFYQPLVRDAGRPGTYRRGATKYKNVPIECYKHVHDRDDLLPPRMMMLAGYIPPDRESSASTESVRARQFQRDLFKGRGRH